MSRPSTGWPADAPQDAAVALAGAAGDGAFLTEALVLGAGGDHPAGEQHRIAPLDDHGVGVLVQLGAVTVVAEGLRILELLDLAVGQQDHHHAPLVAQLVQQVQNSPPMVQGEDVALLVADVLDVLDVVLLTHLPPDQPLQPVQGVDHGRLVLVRQVP